MNHHEFFHPAEPLRPEPSEPFLTLPPMKHDPIAYTQLKDRLIGLIKEVEPLAELIDSEFRSDLNRQATKLEESAFRITLAGGFQEGKSTTFNAICGGMDLSPVGSGIKTSACVTVLKSTADPKKNESAEIVWKTPSHLKALSSAQLEAKVSQILSRNPDNDPWTIADSDIENPSHRNRLAEVIKELFEEWNRDRGKFEEDILDLIRCWKLILDHYPVYRNKLGSVGPIESLPRADLSEGITFPKDWNDRWSNGWNARFAWKEVCFVFVAEVRIYQHVEALSRMGCELVDAPGQGASNWDNLVANEAYLKSDAILALWDGSKEIGEKTLSMIENITALKDKNALFLGCNQRQSSDATERIFGSSLSRLKNKNIEFSGNNAAIYHARLALHALQLKRIQAGSLTVTPEYRKKLEKHLRRDVEDVLDEDAPFENPDAYLAASKLPQLMKNIEVFIYERKGNTLLIAAGANPILQKLKTCKSQLEIEWKQLNVSEFELVEKVGIAENAVATFVEEAQGILKNMMSKAKDANQSILHPFMDKLNRELQFEANVGEGKKITGFAKRLVQKIVTFKIVFKGKKTREAWLKNMVSEAMLESELHRLPEPTVSAFSKEWMDDQSATRKLTQGVRHATQSSLQEAWTRAKMESDLLPSASFESMIDTDVKDALDLELNSPGGAAISALIINTILTFCGGIVGPVLLAILVNPWFLLLIIFLAAGGMVIADDVAEKKILNELEQKWPEVAEAIRAKVEEKLQGILGAYWKSEHTRFYQLLEQRSTDLHDQSQKWLKNLQQDEAVIASRRKTLDDHIQSIGKRITSLEQFTKDAEKQFPTRAA
jgi:hypothetical protein